MFTNQDLALHKGLVDMLNKAEFPLKRRELRACEAICNWAAELGPRMEKGIKDIKPIRSKAKIKKTGGK